MPARIQAQLAIDETQIDNSELERALEERLRRKHSAAELAREYKEAHDNVIGLIEAAKLDVPNEGVGALRIGRFRLTRAISKARAVSFETEEKSRIAIAADSDE